MRIPQTAGTTNLDYILLHFPVVGKTGDRFIKDEPVVLVVEIHCRWCGKVFCICQSCWRGQAYCSDECRIASTRKSHQQAQRRYRKTEKGKKAHREAENRRRMGLSKKIEKNMDDRGSTPRYGCSIMPAPTSLGDKRKIDCAGSSSTRFGWCHFCGCFGVIVERFPRRGYGNQNYRVKMAFFPTEKAKDDRTGRDLQS